MLFGRSPNVEFIMVNYSPPKGGELVVATV